MSQRQLKTGYFVLEGLNSFSTVFYLYYLYFFMRTAFGFDNEADLALAAFNGFICMAGSFWAGQFAQRSGCFTSVKLGLAISILALLVGTQIDSAGGQIAVMAFTVLGVCFTWPALEALVSDGEPPDSLPRMIGIYNVVWAATAALANFTGGAMLDKLGLKSLFWVPIAIQIVQLGLTILLQRKSREFDLERSLSGKLVAGSPRAQITAESHGLAISTEMSSRNQDEPRKFLRMAWLANPFAYIAINTLVAVIPGIAGKFGLSTMAAGFCCSIWCFARLGAFWWLWHWRGWHYRFRWLLAAYLAFVFTFATLVLAPNLAVLVLAQIIFGVAVGLIYYSSLFYSMDRTENRAQQGGIHEAAIGLGNFAGPAVGAASLHFLPQHANSAAVAVSTLLILGLGGLVSVWSKSKA
ncbi:MAG TPA: MFS transporter [Candidatus Eisenbacteria bacterium]|nr:MFS transporter [Candidatus Eisenbacteria bacterium]